MNTSYFISTAVNAGMKPTVKVTHYHVTKFPNL